jgi:hypothetical protein
MKLSGEGTDSAAISLLDSHESGPHELFNVAADGKSSARGLRLIVSCSDTGLANDYRHHSSGKFGQKSSSTPAECLSPDTFRQKIHRGEVKPTEIVLFLDRGVTTQVLNSFAALTQLASNIPFICIAVLPSLQNHLYPTRIDDIQPLLDELSNALRKSGDGSTTVETTSSPDLKSADSLADESLAVRREAAARLIVLRTGYVLSPSSSMTKKLKRLRRFRALLGPQLTSTFVTGEKLFSAINAELERAHSGKRTTSSAVTSVLTTALTSHTTTTDNASSDDSQDLSGDDSSRSQAKLGSAASYVGNNTTSGNTSYLTILGIRRSWHAMLTEQMPEGSAERSAGKAESLVASLFKRLGVSWLVCTIIRLFGVLVPSFRQVHFDTLKPGSVREIISLYNRHNCRDVQLAGYNNGVNHFGWKFPEKTVVLTTGLPGKTQLSDASMLDLEARLRSVVQGERLDSTSQNNATVSGTHFTVDAGLTLKHCIQELNKVDREFYVVPNYSWISMGTLYFVPVHGSGSHVSTLGDTIEDVLLYDGDTEEFIFARRGEKLFRDAMYDTSRHRLLLRLTLRVKPKSVYSVKHETLENPSAEDVLNVFEDPLASNVEIRKNRAANTSIDIRRYYVDSPTAAAGALEMPRDSIGRVWDRLEETPIVSTLFHWFVRRFAFHVELFLRPEEFVIFWNHHQSLPISKIQLRQMLKDGMTNSACAHENCLSADLFMTRSNRDVFLGFISTHLPHVRCNPGKQSL